MFNPTYLIFICYVPILMHSNIKLYGDIGIEWLFFYLLFISFLYEILLNKRKILFGYWNLFILLYTLIVFSSISWSCCESYSIFNLKRIFARYFVPFIISILSMSYFSREEDRSIFLKHISISVLFLSIVALIQLFTGWHITEENRASSLFHNPNAFAVFLVIIIPSLYYTLEKKFFGSKIRWIFFIIPILGIISTGSRKGFITCILAFILYFLLKKDYKKLFITLCSVFLLIIIFSSYSVLTHRLTQETSKQELRARLNAAMLGLKMFMDHPVAGLGYKGYVDNSLKYRGTRYGRSLEAHNNYATILANYGVIGFVPFILIFIFPFYKSISIFFRRLEYNESKDYAIILISTIVPFMINAFFAGGLYGNWPIINMLYAIIAMCLTKITFIE